MFYSQIANIKSRLGLAIKQMQPPMRVSPFDSTGVRQRVAGCHSILNAMTSRKESKSSLYLLAGCQLGGEIISRAAQYLPNKCRLGDKRHRGISTDWM